MITQKFSIAKSLPVWISELRTSACKTLLLKGGGRLLKRILYYHPPIMASLYTDLEKVNTFRNTRVAHVETRLNNAEEAWEAMRTWLRTLNQMVDIAG